MIGKLLGDVRPLLMVTDPPYGVAYDPAWRNQTGAAQTKRTGKVLNDDRADWREAWALFPGDVAYVWHGALHAGADYLHEGRAGRAWSHQNGAAMTLAKLAIDTGDESAAVYAWARAQGTAQVVPVRGLEGFNRATPVSGPTFVDATVNGRKLKRGARLWSVATATFKAET